MPGPDERPSAAIEKGPGRLGRRLLHPVDLAVAAIIFAICGALYWVTTGFEEVSDMLAQNVPPEFFPRLVMLVIVILTLGLPFEHILQRKRGDDIDSERRKRLRPMPYLTAAFLVLTVAAMPWLGTLLTLMLICLGLPPLWGERRWVLILPFALVFPLVVGLLFNRVLLVHFEPGVFGIVL